MEKPVNPPVEISPAKKVRKKLKKALTHGVSLEGAQDIINQGLAQLQADFMKRVKDSEFKTIEELKQELAPWIAKRDGPGRIQGTTDELYEEKLLLAYRLHSQGVSTKDLAKHMGVGIHMARQYIKDVRVRIRVDPESLDLPFYIGDSLYAFKEVREVAMEMMSNKKAPDASRTSAMNVVIKCEEAKNDFLTRVGLYHPSIVSQFQALVLNANNTSFGHVQQEDNMGAFLTNIGKGLIKHAQEKRRERPLEIDVQPIAQEEDESAGE